MTDDLVADRQPAKGITMRGLTQGGFGSPDNCLVFRDIAKPVPGDGEVLIRVHAASIHVGDVFAIEGFPKAMRAIFRSMRAANGVVGTDVAGTVAAVGSGSTGFSVGDEVLGTAVGAFAEYTIAKAELVALKPANITFEQASALGVSAFTALQALRDEGQLQPRQTVLVTGASGGVGSFAVQIARAMGAEVTAVCSGRNADLVLSLGAEHVVDYTTDDFTRLEHRYDLILDNIGSHSLRATRRALKPEGVSIPNGSGRPQGWFGGLGRPLGAFVTSVLVKQQGRPFVSKENKEDLATLIELVAKDEVVPVVDRSYAFDDAIEAFDHVRDGHTRGTTVVAMGMETEA